MAPTCCTSSGGGWKSAKVLLDTYSHWIEEAAEDTDVAATSKQTSTQNLAAGQVGAMSVVPQSASLTV